MQEDPDTNVDRSRLTLLLGLSSTAASAGCRTTTPVKKKKNPYATFDRRNVDAFEPEGGEGGEGGGGGSH